MNTKETKTYSSTSQVGTSETYRSLSAKAYISLLRKLSYIYKSKDNTQLYGIHDEVVGYESSWAGISNSADLK